MLKSFCDKCHQECHSSTAASRRFEHLSQSLDGLSVGLEILILSNKAISPTCHICDECLTELLTLAIDTFVESKLVKHKYHWATKLKSFEQLETEMNKRVAVLEGRETEASDRMREAAEVKSIAEKQRALDANQIQILQAKVNALTHAEESRTKTLIAQQRQREEDERVYPEYIKKVEAREKRRSS